MAWKGLMFKPEAKEKFLEALRSGKYPQGTGLLGVLTKNGAWLGLCCFGVFALINGVPHSTEAGTSLFDFGPGQQFAALPPSEWMRKFIISEGTAPISLANISSLMELLATKNDRGVSFPEIADWVEETL